MLRRNVKQAAPQAPAGDLRVVQRAGRIAALQASVALAAVLLVVGAVVFVVDVRMQNRQINGQLQAVAATADDVSDPPPGMELVLRDNTGKVSVSDGGQPGVGLLAGPTGSSDIRVGHTEMRAFVMNRPDGTVVALLDLAPYRAGRDGVLLSLGLAELAGILASIGVVVLFTRRSVRPLARALTLQRRFIADASHELRAPLTVLHTRAQLLASRVADGDRLALQNDADALVADTRVLGDIVEDLLASATMTAGSKPREIVNVSEVASSVCDSMRAYAESLGVAISFESDKDLRSDVIGSAAALRRALTSLIDNALAHEHVGGAIDVRVGRQDDRVIVTVVDDGAGIDPQTMSTMFARFSHGSLRTEATRHQPHGIGLALVRDIAQAHDGEIAVASEPGEGSTFTLTLPAATPR
jgi:signal transduction histidine kinase